MVTRRVFLARREVPEPRRRSAAAGVQPTARSPAFPQERTDRQYIEIDAGHDAMMTSPEAVADLLAALTRGLVSNRCVVSGAVEEVSVP